MARLRHAAITALTVFVLGLSMGCSSIEHLRVTSEPPGAKVSVDKEAIGLAPVVYTYDTDVTRRFTVTGELEGYFPESIPLKPSHEAVEEGKLEVRLRENPAWKVTTTLDAANEWIHVQIMESLSRQEMWETIINAVTNAYDRLEQLDPSSGYLCFTANEQNWDIGANKGIYHVRTRLIGAIESSRPLVYKFKIIAECRWSHSRDWQLLGRVFTKDAEMLTELIPKLGTKLEEKPEGKDAP